jgi:hypothetical protein
MTGKWIYQNKFHSDGSLARYKARWVVRGFTQQHGVGQDETFSPVIKSAMICVILSIASSWGWPIHQLDVKNVFLHGNLLETIYAQQPDGFLFSSNLEYVCKLHKSLYGLKQAPHTWFLRFTSILAKLGFRSSKPDSSLFVPRHGSSLAYLLLYVDDIILTASSTTLPQTLINHLQYEFAMSDLDPLQHFLGISVHRNKGGLLLSQ